MNPEIASFVRAKDVAIVGVSRKKGKFGNVAHDTLKQRGYNLFPVNPEGNFFGGIGCFRSLEEIPSHVRTAVITTKPESAETVVADAIRLGFKNLWFQQGGNYATLAARAREAGINVITGKCILLYTEPVTGIHSVHKFLSRLFGQW